MYRTVERLGCLKRTAGFAAELPKAQRAALLQQPEALYAALVSQLHRRDTVLVQGGGQLLQVAMNDWFAQHGRPGLRALAGTDATGAAVAAGMALRIADRLQLAGRAQEGGSMPRPVIISLLNSLPADPGLLDLLHTNDLPVLLVAICDGEARADAQRRLLSTAIPLLPVESGDAVALCRVLQECLARARNGWGPSMLHVITTASSPDPVLLLAQHLQKRGQVD